MRVTYVIRTRRFSSVRRVKCCVIIMILCTYVRARSDVQSVLRRSKHEDTPENGITCAIYRPLA